MVNLVTTLARMVESEYCVHSRDMAVWIEAHRSFVFPDIWAIKGKARFADAAKRRLLNPRLIIEITTPESAGYDYGSKFYKYRSLDSLREYVLIDSSAIFVDRYYREPGLQEWRIDSCNTIDDSLDLLSLGMQLPLTEIYRRVNLPEEREEE